MSGCSSGPEGKAAKTQNTGETSGRPLLYFNYPSIALSDPVNRGPLVLFHLILFLAFLKHMFNKKHQQKNNNKVCKRAKDVSEDVCRLLSEAEDHIIGTEVTRTRRLEAGKVANGRKTGNDGGKSKQPAGQEGTDRQTK